MNKIKYYWNNWPYEKMNNVLDKVLIVVLIVWVLSQILVIYKLFK